MNTRPTLLLAALALALGAARAADTGVVQDPAALARLRALAAEIRLPPGFTIAPLALVPDARQIAVSDDGQWLWVGTQRRQTLWAVQLDPARERALQVRALAPPAGGWRIANGVCLGAAGELFVAELNRVSVLPQARAAMDAAAPAWRPVVAEGALIPRDEESPNHGARVCRVGPDGKLYIALGQPYNVQPRDKLARYAQWGIGGIVRMNTDGSGREVFASGIRNSVGLAFHPGDGSLWFTDNQTDGMGDDIPAGEINRATRPGQFFGYPWVCGRTRITQHGYDRDPLPADAVAPEVYTDAHAADLGLAFVTDRRWPARWQGALVSAQHGSWNRSTPIGARVLITPLDAQGRPQATQMLAEGWKDEAGRYRGRPVDVAFLPDGSLVVSDDHAGALWRIRPPAP
jgi:glucose/arabinose dehydrogenase